MPKKDKRCVAFGQAVRKYRHAKGISQEALAELTSIHRTYIGGIERGERNPTLLMIHRIAEALDVTPARLLKPLQPDQGTE